MEPLPKERLLIAAAGILCAVPIVIYLYVALSRLGYPYALEWVEGNAFMHVVRVMQGKPIYVPPSYEFIPMIYSPLYYYAAAPLAVLTGRPFLAMRLVSLGASLLAFAALFGIARARGNGVPAALLAPGLFAGAYALTGYWFDIGRVDMLFLGLVLAAIWLAVRDSGRDDWAGVLAAVVLCLAFGVKQQAVVAFPFLFLELVLRRRFRKALIFGGVFTVLFSAGLLLANARTDGWFWFYAYTLPSAAPRVAGMGRRFWRILILDNYYPLLGLAVLGIAARFRGSARKSGLTRTGSLALIVGPLVGMAYLSLAKQWGYINGLAPAAAGLAILGAEALDGLVSAEFGRGLLNYAAAGAGLVLAAAQLLRLGYDPRPQIPAPGSALEGDAWVAELRGMAPPVFVPSAPYLLYLAGQPTHFHASSLGDLQLGAVYDPPVEAVYNEHLDAIVAPLDDLEGAVLPNATWYDTFFSPENGFTCETRHESEPAFRAVTGATSYLRMVCTRDSPGTAAP